MMEDKTLKPNSLQELYIEQLRDLYDAEQQIIKAIPEMIVATRLEKIFTGLGVLDEGSDLVDDIDDPTVRDAAIVASAQRVEHYEIAGYGTARTLATLLENDEASTLLQQTLDEEKEADNKLTTLAEQINVNATAGKSVGGDRRGKSEKKISAA